jgi:hypothetical protein
MHLRSGAENNYDPFIVYPHPQTALRWQYLVQLKFDDFDWSHVRPHSELVCAGSVTQCDLGTDQPGRYYTSG